MAESPPDAGVLGATGVLARFSSRHPAWLAALPVGIALLVHGRAVTFPFVALDDPVHCTENALVVAPLSKGALELFLTRSIGYPVPVTVLSYALDHALAGFSSGWFHLVNVLLHALSVGLVVNLARALSLSRWAAVLAGTLFAVHPLVVEPVAWVTGRKDLLATCFVLAALTLVTRPPGTAVGRGRWATAVALGLLGTLSKTTALVFPLMLWIAVRRRIGREGQRRASIATAVGLTLSSAVLAVGLWVVRQQQAIEAVSATDRALGVAGAWTVSSQHLIAPVGLYPYYFQWDGDPSRWAMAVALLAGVALAVAYFRWLSPGSAARVAFAWAALAYLPVCGIVGHHRWTADSYLYLSLTGFSIGVSALVERAVASRMALTRRWFGPALAVALGPMCVAQAEVWRHPEMIWRAVSARYPQSPVALSELAATLRWLGRETEAVETYLLLDERFPRFEQCVLPRVGARLVAGNAARALELLRMGMAARDPEAGAFYLRLVLDDPTLPAAPADLRTAFELSWPALASVRDPALFLHLGRRLTRAGLEQEAALSDARRRALIGEKGYPGPVLPDTTDDPRPVPPR